MVLRKEVGFRGRLGQRESIPQLQAVDSQCSLKTPRISYHYIIIYVKFMHPKNITSGKFIFLCFNAKRKLASLLSIEASENNNQLHTPGPSFPPLAGKLEGSQNTPLPPVAFGEPRPFWGGRWFRGKSKRPCLQQEKLFSIILYFMLDIFQFERIIKANV